MGEGVGGFCCWLWVQMKAPADLHPLPPPACAPVPAAAATLMLAGAALLETAGSGTMSTGNTDYMAAPLACLVEIAIPQTCVVS